MKMKQIRFRRFFLAALSISLLISCQKGAKAPVSAPGGKPAPRSVRAGEAPARPEAGRVARDDDPVPSMKPEWTKRKPSRQVKIPDIAYPSPGRPGEAVSPAGTSLPPAIVPVNPLLRPVKPEPTRSPEPSMPPGEVGPQSMPLAALAATGSRYPEDFDIGKLQGRNPPDKEEAAAAAVAFAFLDALAKGEYDRKLAGADMADELGQSLRTLLAQDKPVRSYRLGLLSVEGDQADANLKLLSSGSRAAGAIHLAKTGGEWKVSAFECDVAELLQDRQPPARIFSPGDYPVFYYR